MVNGASAGYVFLCSGTTESECITKGLFGASIQNFEQHIGPETVLFLYNISSKQLKGLWLPRQVCLVQYHTHPHEAVQCFAGSAGRC